MSNRKLLLLFIGVVAASALVAGWFRLNDQPSPLAEGGGEGVNVDPAPPSAAEKANEMLPQEDPVGDAALRTSPPPPRIPSPVEKSGVTETMAASDDSARMDPVARIERLDQWIAMGGAAIPELREMLVDLSGDFEARRLAAEALAGIGSDEALQAMFEAIATDPDAQNRLILANALDALSDPDSVEPVTSLLETSDDPSVHSAVYDTLSRLAQAETISYLVEMHTQQAASSGGPTPASIGLSSIRNSVAMDAIAAVLEAPETPVELREAAARSLAKTASKESILELARIGGQEGGAGEVSRRQLEAVSDPSSLSTMKELANSAATVSVREAASRAIERMKEFEELPGN